MKLRDSRVFKAFALVLMSLALVSFALHSAQKVMTGHGFETYLTGKGLVLNYWSAVVIVVATLVAGVVAFAFWLRKRLKNTRRA
jgi:hypothetical protein